MARMHSRRKGKSGSNKPSRRIKPEWVKQKPSEVEDLIIELKKKDLTTSKIGSVLRDAHGIPSVKSVTGKKIGKIINEKGLSPKIPEDLMNLMKRAVNLRKHMDVNKHDLHNKRYVQLIESKIGRLIKYYKNTGKLPLDWKYSYDKAKLLVE